jgi:hypothetical protein
MVAVSFAAQAYVKPHSLEQAMEMMESRLKKIKVSSTRIEKYDRLAILADELASITDDAKVFIPTIIKHAPPQEREIQKDLYLSMMDDLNGLGVKLAEVLRSKNQVKVQEILSRIKKAENEGHGEFKKGDHYMHSALTMPNDLKTTMKQVGSTLKIISMQVQDANQNTSSAKMAEEVVLLLEHSKKFTPDLIVQAPAADQAEMKLRYDQMIDESIGQTRTLSEAFKANNTKLAIDTLDQLSLLKKEGHAEFK